MKAPVYLEVTSSYIPWGWLQSSQQPGCCPVILHSLNLGLHGSGAITRSGSRARKILILTMRKGRRRLVMRLLLQSPLHPSNNSSCSTCLSNKHLNDQGFLSMPEKHGHTQPQLNLEDKSVHGLVIARQPPRCPMHSTVGVIKALYTHAISVVMRLLSLYQSSVLHSACHVMFMIGPGCRT